MMMNGSRPNLDYLFYDTRVEIFMALRDVSYTAKVSRKMDLGFSSTPKIHNQQIIAYWKPPGSDQWIERCRTEVLPGKLARFLQFVIKVYLDIEVRDAASTLLRFDIGHADLVSTIGLHKEISRWSTAEIALDKLINAGATGVELVLPLILEPCSKGEWDGADGNKMTPGVLFLRAEILQKPIMGIAIQFGIEAEHPATCSDYYIEFYKLNQESNFDIPNPYTLIYRSDLGKTLDDLSQFCGKPQYFLESRIGNGNPERVLKIEVYKKISHTKKGFALTTLGNLVNEGLQAIPVDRVDPNPKLSFCQTNKPMTVIMKLCKEIPLKRLTYYFHMGFKILRIYAVDYSRSNWDTALHKSVLHDSETRFNPYEDALEMLAKINSDISFGDSIFYSFGNTKDSYFGTFPEDHHLNSLIASYRAALCSEKMSSLEINEMETVSTVSSEGDESGSCVPLIYRPMPVPSLTKTHLSPLLDDICSLLNTRNATLEYYSVYILTDGQIEDVDKVVESINELSKMPVSIIFIGIGLGCFEKLRYLENVGNVKPAQGNYRKCVKVIHFRSSFNWSTSIMFHKMCVHPLDVFRKEVLTAVRDQALAYFRIYYPDL